METLYLDHKDSEMTSANKQLVVSLPMNVDASLKRQTLTQLPLTQLKNVVITSDCQISTKSLMALGKAGVSVCCLNTRDPEASIYCYHSKHGNAFRRMAQYQLYADSDRSLGLARLLIKHKLLKHAQQLKQFALAYPSHRFILNKVAVETQHLSNRTDQASDMAQLLGYEGAAGKRYFEAYKLLFAQSWDFNERNRRPPKDPVNAILSLSYALVHYEAVRACLALGLETQIGVLHRISYNRDSLACDLVELFRSHINSWVLTQFKQGTFKTSHFKTEYQSCLLTKEGSRVFYPAFHAQGLAWRKMLRQYTRRFAHYLDMNFQEMAA
jgi:CRISPR-associated protein Cas1